MATPPPVYDTLVVVRRKYPANAMGDALLIQMLNEVAWIHKDIGWGLLKKPSGSNGPQPVTGIMCARDILANQKDGSLVDVLIDAEGIAKPSWGTVKALDKPWAAPVEYPPYGSEDSSQPPPTQPSTVIPPYNESYAVQFGLGCNDVYKEANTVSVDPGMISVHSTRAAWDYYSGTLTWDASYKKHINEFRVEYGLSPV